MDSVVEYRPVKGFPRYRVGSDGTLWSQWNQGARRIDGKWRLLKPFTNHHGRYYAYLCNGEKPKRFSINRLILTAFAGPCPDGMECCHNDGNPANNAVSNLRWDTRESNMADKVLHGTHNRGERHPLSKLTVDKVISIRNRYAAGGCTHRSLAKEFGVIHQAIGLIVNQKRWAHF
jgi:HNH endonuclease